MNTEKPTYTAIATAQGGRNGRVKTSDGVLDLKVSTPKDFGGQDEGHTNPEQLFASAWAACFDNALILVAKARKLDIIPTTTVEITFGPDESGHFELSSVIKVKIEGIETADAEKIMKSAHNVCPYSKATKGNISSKVMLVS